MRRFDFDMDGNVYERDAGLARVVRVGGRRNARRNPVAKCPDADTARRVADALEAHVPEGADLRGTRTR